MNDAPRPYLSDLAVHKNFRRRGVAKALIRKCEEESKAWNKNELFLRVEQKNDGALKMYSDLGYVSLDHPYFGVKDTTILLKRDFGNDDPNRLVSSPESSFSNYCI